MLGLIQSHHLGGTHDKPRFWIPSTVLGSLAIKAPVTPPTNTSVHVTHIKGMCHRRRPKVQLSRIKIRFFLRCIFYFDRAGIVVPVSPCASPQTLAGTKQGIASQTQLPRPPSTSWPLAACSRQVPAPADREVDGGPFGSSPKMLCTLFYGE